MTHRVTTLTASGGPRKRRPRNELKALVIAYLESLPDRTAKTSEIRAATSAELDDPPQSSYRSLLQDSRYFERKSRGEFMLVDHLAGSR